VGAGAWKDVDAACDAALQVAETLQPQAQNRITYEHGYATYRKIYPATRSLLG
jgi:sugar (pentulose or hexulose) kinase